MAIDRQAIEKKDFPIARRGYDPEAVDLHLSTLASEVEGLQRRLDEAGPAAPAAAAPRQGPASLALAASEQVRSIVEAAETSAADIERAAQDEAARIRSEADAAARKTREDAVARSSEHVGQVSEATSTMLQRVDAMESELGALLESLKTGTNRLTADLSLLEGNMGELYGAAGKTAPPTPPVAEPVAVAPVAPEPVAAEPEPIAPEPEPEPVAAEPEPEPVAVAAEPDPIATPAAASASGSSDGDVEGARLIALNMALNGESRDETDAYLRDNFDLSDRSGLLDEVYATIEG